MLLFVLELNKIFPVLLLFVTGQNNSLFYLFTRDGRLTTVQLVAQFGNSVRGFLKAQGTRGLAPGLVGVHHLVL